MPFLNVGMSIGGVWLASSFILFWIVQGLTENRWTDPWKSFIDNIPALLLAFFFLAHVAALLYTDDIERGLRDIKIKLPLLSFAIVFAAIPSLSRHWRPMLLKIFVSGVCLSAIIITIIYLLEPPTSQDVRQAHVFISHIRFGLMCALAFAISLSESQKPGKLRPLWFFSIALLIAYSVILQNLTALSGILITFVFLPLSLSGEPDQNRQVKAFILLGAAIFVALGIYITKEAIQYFPDYVPQRGEIKEYNENGRMYYHQYGDSQVENGNLVWYYLEPRELQQHWLERSGTDLSDLDAKGNTVYGTLVRYLSSKGLTKDSAGVFAMSEQDILAVKAGIPNYLEPSKPGYQKRLEQIFFELNAYGNGANPGGNSITQRLEFWKTGLQIGKEHPLGGIGTGDIGKEYARKYEEINSPLERKYRLRAHNQYITSWLGNGIIGISLLLLLLMAPFYCRKWVRAELYLPLVFLGIIALSFISEDTLETQAGVTFFGYFYGLLILSVSGNNRDSIKA
jgi:O-antigen ligase